jgi:hypothetical protein
MKLRYEATCMIYSQQQSLKTFIHSVCRIESESLNCHNPFTMDSVPSALFGLKV